MRIFAFVICLTLASACFAFQTFAQETLAPLYLFTNGIGSITPLQNGQMVDVGQSYEMTALPDSDYAFSSWQPVNVFVLTTVEIDYNTDPPTTNVITQTATSLVPEYTEEPVLEFTMQQENVLYDSGGNSLVEYSGWQANFVPVCNLQIVSVTNSQCVLTITGPPYLNYTIQMTSDLTATSWTDIATFSPTNRTFSFTDTSATNNCQFYRALVQ